MTNAHPAFRQAEKHFKNRATHALPALRNVPPALCRPVLDLSRPDSCEDDEVWLAGWWGRAYEPPVTGQRPRKTKERPRGERAPHPNHEAEGVRSISLADGKIGYVVSDGCVLIPGHFDTAAQEALLTASLAEYTRPPNPLSLDTHYALPINMFELYASAPDRPVLPRHLELDEDERASRTEEAQRTAGTRPLIETAPAFTMGFDEVKRRNATWTGDAMSLKAGTKSVGALMKEIRWANLGWVYQWSTKSYDFSTDTPIPFPPDLAKQCREVVNIVPWDQVYAGTEAENTPNFAAWSEDYEPDTGIVNFYQLNDTLMAHVDRSELDNSRPLVSISLGHAALFLLGSGDRADPPRPLILRSGDVLIMSGRGRQAYHGVPRILEDSLPAHLRPREDDSPTLAAVKRWISTARINVNARQVFPPGFKPVA
ncbi:hypothetical protein CcaverHIS002_0106250 [Cutaneotrichosporon cavernicola]|uniref:Fe2OG dioxygenase domain-containing protein n=1 Tax=Cutaneotrichosporon cavernicola TaxID=279322 RepID=A0AA48IBP9_9TREE|nr:uncharacterized protein CcaverHIS019_0106190 [Cutaneotrichosporon cavernicola]BEI80096.1 hypothetical protein CcaverHIS002_0106250 [Cutaneotrichosporon cavernicola]BEI87901.1 hypothetical protein CcaverHIS019_0106190 [Cutaneotrichosporon cavernicola]BEI95675.1 hypothetical protein CcaverHIS631_0106240 [Cutaneotrichosporon cavernicola]BEJ03449.1 hypothetical protein CcaverHIS641_0106240 [Cutaneotrichosporon cavernicola]